MKNLYRADSYYKTIEYVEVYDVAPVGEELFVLMGEGTYIYYEKEEEAKAWLLEKVQEELDDLMKVKERLLK